MGEGGEGGGGDIAHRYVIASLFRHPRRLYLHVCPRWAEAEVKSDLDFIMALNLGLCDMRGLVNGPDIVVVHCKVYNEHNNCTLYIVQAPKLVFMATGSGV